MVVVVLGDEAADDGDPLPGQVLLVLELRTLSDAQPGRGAQFEPLVNGNTGMALTLSAATGQNIVMGTDNGTCTMSAADGTFSCTAAAERPCPRSKVCTMFG